MKKLITISNNPLVDYLESLYYEVNSRMSLIDFLLAQGHDENNPFIQNYIKEYQDFFIKYTIAKNKFEREYILEKYPKTTNWNLNFTYKELELDMEEE